MRGPMEDCTAWSHQHTHAVLESDIPLLTVRLDGEYAPARTYPEDEVIVPKKGPSTGQKRKRTRP